MYADRGVGQIGLTLSSSDSILASVYSSRQTLATSFTVTPPSAVRTSHVIRLVLLLESVANQTCTGRLSGQYADH